VYWTTLEINPLIRKIDFPRDTILPIVEMINENFCSVISGGVERTQREFDKVYPWSQTLQEVGFLKSLQ